MVIRFDIRIIILLCVFLFQNCRKFELIEPVGFETTIEADSVVIAVIGDYGFDGSAERSVSDMVKSWTPDFIISLGDNNYGKGEFRTLRQNIGKYYGDYIYNFDASSDYKCNGQAFRDSINRFFPCPGNHDTYNRNGMTPYLNYFTLPGQENFYKFVWGSITFYSLDSELENIDLQRLWLFEELEKSYTPFNVVFFHSSPWSTGPHGNNELMQWDFYHHGVDLVLTGHDHIYSRIEKIDEPGMYYIVNGLGGKSLYECVPDALPGDRFISSCYNDNYGAMKVKANFNCLEIQFLAISDVELPIDSFTICK